nr:caspase recruitment domain-containing protein 19 isoform X1 [Anas platyrhynchos]XP_038042038.1 caspase recruitment domain-containing protein 19 isoform X1 [Anas platyrhynchos]
MLTGAFKVHRVPCTSFLGSKHALTDRTLRCALLCRRGEPRVSWDGAKDPRAGLTPRGRTAGTRAALAHDCHTADQSYCQRLQHDMYFLTSNSRLNEQVVDKIILQLNRVYPQILTDTEAEKFRNPKASLHTRLSYLIKHLQKKGDRHCQEFYRALQINAEQLYNDLPSRKILMNWRKEQYSKWMGNMFRPPACRNDLSSLRESSCIWKPQIPQR